MSGLVVAALMLSLLYFFQNRLLFFPQPLPPAAARLRELPGVEEIRIVGEDGINLHGWLAKPASSGPHPLVIYFGGNAEEVSYLVPLADRFAGHALLALNYRGYGASEGKPSEQSMLRDALAIYDYARSRADIDGRRIVAVGGSLGSGVAVALAAERDLAGVILATPYDSMVEVARHHYPFLPVSLLLRNRFDSVARAGAMKVPMLMLTAGNDTTIPRARSDALYDRWGGPKSRRDFPGTDHNSVYSDPGYWKAVAEFLVQVRALERQP